MLYAAKEIWASIQDFMKRITTLETKTQKTERDVEHVGNKVEVLERVVRHHGQVQDYQGKQLAEAQHEIKKLKSEKHGAKVSAGKAKKEVERLKEELNGPRDPKRRH